LGTSPAQEMVKSIEAQVEHESREEEKALDSTPTDTLLGVNLQSKGDIGEGNDMVLESRSHAAAKDAALTALKEAQDAQDTLNVKKSMPVPAKNNIPAPAKNSMPAKKSMPRAHATDITSENPDPVDEMKSVIRAEIHDGEFTAAPSPEDPLDRAIDQITVVRNREKMHDLPGSVEMLSEEEEIPVKTNKDDKTKTDDGCPPAKVGPDGMPESERAPDGPPNPPVVDVEPDVFQRIPLASKAPKAPADAAALDSALQQMGAPTKTHEASSADGNSTDSKTKVDEEIKQIKGHPISDEEAINEAVSKLVPWEHRLPERKDSDSNEQQRTHSDSNSTSTDYS